MALSWSFNRLRHFHLKYITSIFEKISLGWFSGK